MKLPLKLTQGFTILRRYRYQWVLIIMLAWTFLDTLLWAIRTTVPQADAFENPAETRTISYALIRVTVVLSMSLLLGYLLVFKFRTMFRNQPLWFNLTMKTLILMAASFLMNFFTLFSYFYFVQDKTFLGALKFYYDLPAEKFWLVHGLPMWLLIFLITQLFIEMSEKYSPGVFADILSGKYIKPQKEERIIIFLDLKDSTPIAEHLGHTQYFLFIRDFIHYVSMALLEHGGRIYQYVGDEIVVSWKLSKRNTDKSILALLDARKALQKHNEHFRRDYGMNPEFRVGIHVGEVTVGEIGTIKKDLAMSGDTMNTTARIRTSCRELNQKWIASKEFVMASSLKDFQTEYLGSFELKGKGDAMDLYGLKI
jgi:adenylate cyclase